jgi:hypothetical protein
MKDLRLLSGLKLRVVKEGWTDFHGNYAEVRLIECCDEYFVEVDYGHALRDRNRIYKRLAYVHKYLESLGYDLETIEQKVVEEGI